MNSASSETKNTRTGSKKNVKLDVSMRDQAVGLTIASKLRARPELLNSVREQLSALSKTGSPKVKEEMSECLKTVDRLPLAKLFEVLEQTTAEGIRLSRSPAFQSILSPQDKRIIVQTTSQ